MSRFIKAPVLLIMFLLLMSSACAAPSGKNGPTRTSGSTTPVGKLRGSSGCNNYTAGYSVSEQDLAIDQIAYTEKMCLDRDLMKQEAEFLEALSTAGTWDIRGERLQLRHSDGALFVDLVSAITGTVTYRARQMLRPGSQIRVSLQDVSRADAEAKVIAEQVISADGKQVPIPSRITFDPTEIDPRFTYAVRAAITRNDELLYLDTDVPGNHS